VYGYGVWDVWKIFREGMEVRWEVESGENYRAERADVPRRPGGLYGFRMD
jgi:hypothetical protein